MHTSYIAWAILYDIAQQVRHNRKGIMSANPKHMRGTTFRLTIVSSLSHSNVAYTMPQTRTEIRRVHSGLYTKVFGSGIWGSSPRLLDTKQGCRYGGLSVAHSMINAVIAIWSRRALIPAWQKSAASVASNHPVALLAKEATCDNCGIKALITY